MQPQQGPRVLRCNMTGAAKTGFHWTTFLSLRFYIMIKCRRARMGNLELWKINLLRTSQFLTPLLIVDNLQARGWHISTSCTSIAFRLTTIIIKYFGYLTNLTILLLFLILHGTLLIWYLYSLCCYNINKSKMILTLLMYKHLNGQ